MAQGLERRVAATDNLRGAEAVDPVTRSVPGVPAPNMPRQPIDSFGAQIAASVSEFASGRLAEIQAKRQEKSMMDGQIAAMQGASFESVEMEGDKWALEGYRLVTAQTLSSNLLRAQEAEINQGGYETDPDAYRGTLVNRIDQMTSGIEDQRTRDLAREQLMKQMPTLVDAHMKQNLAFKEQQNFDALAGSIDSISRDSNSTDSLIDFATGASGVTAGLSTERRKAAVVTGIVNSFANGNPAAYAKLEAAGFLTTENMTASQLQQIENAKSMYHSRMEQTWNAEWKKEDTRIREMVARGDLDELVATEMYAANNAKHGHRVTAAGAGQIYEAARIGVEFDQGTRGLNIQAAAAAGNFKLQAELLQDAVIKQESRGDPNAVSPKGATGIMQLMPATAMKPGFGVRNIFEVARSMGRQVIAENEGMAEILMRDAEVNAAMGTEYLATMLKRYGGDVTRALAAYNWGADNVDKWDGDIAKLPAETRTYIKNITGTISDDTPDPKGQRIAAEAHLKAVRQQAALDAYENALPQLNQLDEMYKTGEIDEQMWRDGRKAEMQAWGAARDGAIINHEAQIHRSVIADVSEKIEKEKATASEIAMRDEMRVVNTAHDAVVAQAEKGLVDQAAVQASLAATTKQNAEIMQKYGYSPSTAEVSNLRDSQVRAAVEAVQLGQKAKAERVERERAAALGSAGALSPQQQKRLMEEWDTQKRKEYTDLIAERGISPEVAEAAYSTERLQYMATSGLVEPIQKRLINAGMNQEPMINGEINPAFKEAVESYMVMNSVNPAVADKYIDAENRSTIDTLIGRVGSQGNVEAAIYSYANEQARAGGKQLFASPQEFMDDPKTQRRIEEEVKMYMQREDVGVLQGLFSGDTMTRQAWDRAGVDLSGAQEAFKDALTREVAVERSHNPYHKTSDIVAAASARVQRQFAVVGDTPVNVGQGNDVHEMFFGNRAEEMRGNASSINSALMDYLRSDEFRTQYPDIENSTFSEMFGIEMMSADSTGLSPLDAFNTFTTGVRPFTVFSNIDNGKPQLWMQYNKPDGSYSAPILLDTKKIGQQYLKTISQVNR